MLRFRIFQIFKICPLRVCNPHESNSLKRLKISSYLISLLRPTRAPISLEIWQIARLQIVTCFKEFSAVFTAETKVHYFRGSNLFDSYYMSHIVHRIFLITIHIIVFKFFLNFKYSHWRDCLQFRVSSVCFK